MRANFMKEYQRALIGSDEDDKREKRNELVASRMMISEGFKKEKMCKSKN